jgi:hypothetical protein
MSLSVLKQATNTGMGERVARSLGVISNRRVFCLRINPKFKFTTMMVREIMNRIIKRKRNNSSSSVRRKKKRKKHVYLCLSYKIGYLIRDNTR